MQVLKKKVINPWTSEQRELLAAVMNEALSMNLTGDNILGVMIDGDRAIVIWLGDGKRQSFYFDKVDLREMIDAKRLEVVDKEFSGRGLKVVGSYTNDGKQVFIVRDRRDTFIGIVATSEDGSWYVTRISGNGRPIRVSGLQDAALSLWMLEVAVVA
jgi:hypothetical protein